MPLYSRQPGRPPAERRVLSPDFVAALEASPYPFPIIQGWLRNVQGSAFYSMKSGKPFAATPLTLSRLRELAERVGYVGEIVAEPPRGSKGARRMAKRSYRRLRKGAKR